MAYIQPGVNNVFTTRRKHNGKNQIFNTDTRRWILQQSATGTKYMTNHKLTRLGDVGSNRKNVFKMTNSRFSKGWVTINYYRDTHITISALANSILSVIKPDMASMWVDIVALDTEGEPHYRSIKLWRGMSKNTLFNRINNTQFEEGEIGSDHFDFAQELNTTFFQLKYKQLNLAGFSGRKDLKVIGTEYFKCLSYPSEEGDCLLAILKKDKQIKTIRKDLGLEGGISINDIDRLEKYFGVNINILNDVVTVNKKIRDKPDSNLTEVTYEYDYYFKTENKEQGETFNILLKDAHYSLIVAFKDLVFDPICGDRLKIVKGKSEPMKPLAIKKSLTRQGRKIAGEKETEHEYEKKLLFFDIETIFNPYEINYIESYSVSWYVCDFTKPIKFSVKNIDKHLKKTGFLRGKDCLHQFIKWIENNDNGIKYYLIGFNNSRFDNFPLLKHLIYNDLFTSMRFVQNSILPVRFGGRHETFDLCRFVMSSLKKACDDFKVFPKKMDGFSHYAPQNAFMKNGWIGLNDWMDENEELLIRYNKIDVLATVNLFHLVRIGFAKLTGTDGQAKDILDYSTLAQLSYDCFKECAKKAGHKIPAAKTAEDDKYIRAAIVGGRCQDFKRKFKKDDFMACVDVKSLYPTVMLKCAFPTDDYFPTKTYREGYLGIYTVKIIKQPKEKIIPNRIDDDQEVLDWDFDGEIITNVTSVDIECLKRHGAIFEFLPGYNSGKNHIGIYWKESTTELFDEYFNPIKDEKTRQDQLLKDGSDDYNPALRNITKLMLNSLSGKFVQRNFEDKTEMVKNGKEEKSFVDKTVDQELKMIIGDYRLLSGKLKKEKIYSPKCAKPSYIGVFIYSYARTYMYDLLYSNYDVLYTDTDSGIMNKNDWGDFKDKYIEEVGKEKNTKYYRLTDKTTNMPTIGGEFGQFEEEFDGEGKDFESYIIGKKMYCVEIKDKKGKICKESKYRLKGVNLKTDRVITIKDAGKMIEIEDDVERAKYMYSLKQELDKRYDELAKVNDKLGNDYQKLLPIEIFRELNNGKAYFLCSQIKKVNCMTMKQSHSIKIVTKSGVQEAEIDHGDFEGFKSKLRCEKARDRILSGLERLERTV
jgi:hypothetical protein